MNNVVDMSQDESRLDAAGHWVVRMNEGLSSSQESALKAWLSEDLKNLDAFMEVAEVWDETACLARLAELFPEPRKRRILPPRFAVATALALVLTFSAASLFFMSNLSFTGFSSSPATANGTQHFETAIGEHSTAVLVDGTVVVLNTNSQIEVAYSDDARVVHLVRGEIHVEVVRDPLRPLSVVAGDRIVQAVGTAFSVEITQDQQIDLVVTEGLVVVGVRAPGAQRIVAPPVIAQSDDNTVAAGENLLMGADEEVTTPVSEEEMEIKLSWREGSLIFLSEPLEQALAEVERYTTVKFIFVDEDLKTRAVSGRYRAGDVDSLLLALRMNFNIAHEVAEDGSVLLSSL
ncbi:MAG: FecR domain-containing protein [Pseudomonadota bacterium]